MIDILNINKIKSALSDYVKVKIELFKLDMTTQISNALAQVIAYFIIILIGGLVVFFVSMGMAFLFNQLLASTYLGFIIVAGIYLLFLLIVLYLLKSGNLKSFFEDKLMENFSSKEESNEE
ncbi:phage holin family protein [Reichenbachiella agarivorans]|uniref:Phage holin family protein n=1 Tax=Reichenbachiella agarivorans TaxID=2979464 RepID=A0ABY6CTC7_9BACT|nr:phage holin family protein [Reichenbachiella agarivorans]UXP33119.1 phage holin family protein [Reichenbachiella agarivorans]